MTSRPASAPDLRFAAEALRTFQLVGFRHVIGTLWLLNNGLAMEAARLVNCRPKSRAGRTSQMRGRA